MEVTVEVAIIGAVATVVAAVIGNAFKSKKRTQQNESSSKDILSNIGSISGSVINVNSPQIVPKEVPAEAKPTSGSAAKIVDQLVDDLHKLQKKEGKPIADLIHKEICDAIESAPPFHQDKIHDSFIGKRVIWEAKLKSISHFKDSTTIFAETPNDVFLSCDSNLESGEAFISATAGTSFVVTGEIRRIARHDAELVNCTYQVLKKGASTVN